MAKPNATEAQARTRFQGRPIRVLIVDDHELMRDGLAQLINHEADLEVCGEATGEAQAWDQLCNMDPDLAIVDVSLRQGDGIELIKRIKSQKPGVRAIVLSMHAESLYAERALCAGAMGYVNKQEPARSIIDAIRHVLDGKLYLSERMTQRMMRNTVLGGDGSERAAIETLSDRELQVFEMIGQGLTTGELASLLQLSPRTIETYRQRLKTKLGLRNAGELSREAVQWVLERR